MCRNRCNVEKYIQFLLASPRAYTCTEAARVQPDSPSAPSHDAFTRLLDRNNPNSDALWQEVQPLVHRERGVLILDDSTLDKPYAKNMGLVSKHWSGKHHAVVQGINLVTLVWHAGDQIVPCDFRIYHLSSDQQTKHDHARAMLQAAKDRGFRPEYVLFDSWYASLDSLKAIRRHGWRWLTRFKANRCVSVAGHRLALQDLDIPPAGVVVHLRGYGSIRVFRLVVPTGDTQYWATNHLQMTVAAWETYRVQGWAIEEYHRGLKQFTGVERCQMRVARKQRNHIGFAVRAFVRLTAYCLRQGVSWWHAKHDIIRDAVRGYLAHPYMLLDSATA